MHELPTTQTQHLHPSSGNLVPAIILSLTAACIAILILAWPALTQIGYDPMESNSPCSEGYADSEPFSPYAVCK